MEIERRFTELRQDGRRLSGTAVRYGDLAQLPWGTERIEAGAFAPLGDVILNTLHDRQTPLARTDGGGLLLNDTTAALEVIAELPPTQAADDVLALVKRKVLRGLSIEFRADSERLEGDIRVIERARLSGVAVVDRPAYPDSAVEARQGGGGLGHIPFRQALDCDCHRGSCDQVRILDAVWPDGGDILAVAGNYSRAIGSRQRGSLTLTKTRAGLDVAVSEAAMKSTVGRELLEMADQVPIFARPIFDQALSQFVETGGVAVYLQMWIKGILIGPTDRNQGWPEFKLLPRPENN